MVDTIFELRYDVEELVRHWADYGARFLKEDDLGIVSVKGPCDPFAQLLFWNLLFQILYRYVDVWRNSLELIQISFSCRKPQEQAAGHAERPEKRRLRNLANLLWWSTPRVTVPAKTVEVTVCKAMLFPGYGSWLALENMIVFGVEADEQGKLVGLERVAWAFNGSLPTSHYPYRTQVLSHQIRVKEH